MYVNVYRSICLFLSPILLPLCNSSILRHLVSSYLSPVKRAPSCPSRFVSDRSGEPSSTSTPSPTIDNRQSELLTHPRRRPSGSSRARSSSSTTSALRFCTCRAANTNYSSRQSTIVNRQGCKASTCVHDAMPRLAQELDLRPWRQAPSSGMHVECECPRHTPTVQGPASNNKNRHATPPPLVIDMRARNVLMMREVFDAWRDENFRHWPPHVTDLSILQNHLDVWHAWVQWVRLATGLGRARSRRLGLMLRTTLCEMLGCDRLGL